MNVLKIIFTRSFVFWLVLVVIYASIQIFRGTQPLNSWIGLELTAVSLLPFFFTYVKNGSATKKSGVTIDRVQVLAYTLVSGLGLVICMAVSYRYRQAAGIIHIWAGATFLGWVVFVRLCLPR